VNQTFSKKNLKHFFAITDLYNTKSESLNLSKLRGISKAVYRENLTLPTFKIRNNIYLTNTIELEYILLFRKLNHNIKKLYQVYQSDRSSIIKQVTNLLSEKSRPFTVLRLDVKKFYDHIDKEKLLTKLIENDVLLSYHSKYLLKELFINHPQFKENKLPFGLNLSSTLSEIYMRSFDKQIRQIEGVYYYARYVDDIIIFSFKQENLTDTVKKFLPENMQLNTTSNKYRFLKITNASDRINLNYLGYSFYYQDKNLKVSIANNKITKIKTRITLSFVDYIRTRNFNLLENRVKYLTGNHIMYKNFKEVKSGIYYNYSYLTDTQILEELTNYLRKTIYSRHNNFGRKFYRVLTSPQKQQLKKHSFLIGFNEKITYKFSASEVKCITKCWNNE
jgi:hypothetical protein